MQGANGKQTGRPKSFLDRRQNDALPRTANPSCWHFSRARLSSQRERYFPKIPDMYRGRHQGTELNDPPDLSPAERREASVIPSTPTPSRHAKGRRSPPDSASQAHGRKWALAIVVWVPQWNDCCVGGRVRGCVRVQQPAAGDLTRRSSQCNGASRVGAEGSCTIELTPPSLGKSIECPVVSCGPALAPLENAHEAIMTIWPAFPLSSGLSAGSHICEHTRCRKIRMPNNEPTQTSFEPSPTVCHPRYAMN
jgi:hypothetical protein